MRTVDKEIQVTISGKKIVHDSSKRRTLGKDFVSIVSMLWSSKNDLVRGTSVVTLITILLAILLQNEYRSTAIILPEKEKGKIANLGGLTDLASLAGINFGSEASVAKLYPVILKSEAVLQDVIYGRFQTERFKDSVNLIQYWKIDEPTPPRNYEAALKRLREDLEVSLDVKTNVVTVSILTTDSHLSADVVNKVAWNLDKFMRTKRTTSASEQRKWIESRLLEVSDDLQKSEDKLKDFRQQNRRVADSPLLLLEQERLIRDLQINTTIYVELKKQHELSKIEEIKDIPIINIMDEGRPAAMKERPKRMNLILFGILFGFFGSAVFVYLRVQFGAAIRQFFSLFVRSTGLP